MLAQVKIEPYTMKNPPDIATNIKYLKEETFISNTELAEKAETSESTIKRIMNSTQPDPPFSVVCGIADAFNVPVDYLRHFRDPRILQRNEYLMASYYRSLDPCDQDKVVTYAKELYDDFKQRQKRIDNDFSDRERLKCIVDKLPGYEVQMIMKELKNNPDICYDCLIKKVLKHGPI